MNLFLFHIEYYLIFIQNLLILNSSFKKIIYLNLNKNQIIFYFIILLFLIQFFKDLLNFIENTFKIIINFLNNLKNQLFILFLIYIIPVFLVILCFINLFIPFN